MEEETNLQKRSKDIGMSDIAGTLGFGFMLSLLLVAFMSDGTGCSASENPALFAALRAMGALALALTLWTVQFFADRLSTRAAMPRMLGASTILMSGSMAILYITHGWQLSAAVPLLCWIGFGAGIGLAFPLWAVFSSMLVERYVPALTALSFLAAGLWGGFTLQMSAPLQPAMAALSSLVAAVLFWAYLREAALPSSITRDESKSRVSLSLRTSAAICCYGTVAALAFQYLAAMETTAARLAACGAFALGALVSLLVAIGSQRSIDPFSFSHSQRFAFPLLIAGLLTATLAWGASWTIAGMTLILTGYFFLDVFNWSTLSSLCSRYRSQPLYQFALGRAPLGLGLFLGWSIAALASGGDAVGSPLFESEGVPALLANSAVAAGAILLLALSVAIAPYGSDTLTDKRTLDKLRSDPMYSRDIKGGLFRRACISVAEEGGLTPREREVLLLLAKGRSAAIIQEELSISPGTVRTHTYHIYRKLDVTSQQEIISLVESRAHPES